MLQKVSNRELATDMMQMHHLQPLENIILVYVLYARRHVPRHLIRKYVIVLQQAAGNLFRREVFCVYVLLVA